MRLILLALVVCLCLPAQQVDWTQIKNAPSLVTPASFAWLRTNGAGASADLSASGSGKVLTFGACPKGLIVGGYVYISGGTGTAEASAITASTCGNTGGSGTITITTANTHVGAWTATSATDGIQEAIGSGGSGKSSAIMLGPQTYTFRASVFIDKNVTILGSGNGCGASSSIALAADGLTAFNVNTPAAIDFRNFCIYSAISPPTSGAGIAITAANPYANTSSKIDHVQFYNLYRAIDASNMAYCSMTDNFFLDIRNRAIIIQDLNTTDTVGCKIVGNDFLQSGAFGDTAVYQTSGGASVFSNNRINGAWAVGYWVNATVAPGTSQIAIANNVIEGTTDTGIRVSGTATFPYIAFTGNRIVNYSDPSWLGIDVQSATGRNGTITGNLISGVLSAGNDGINLTSTSNYIVTGNTFDSLSVGVQVINSSSNIDVGPNNYASVTTPVYLDAGGTGVTNTFGGPMVFSLLGAPKNGSIVYCSNCTVANPCGTGGTGAIAKRLNNAWVCN